MTEENVQTTAVDDFGGLSGNNATVSYPVPIITPKTLVRKGQPLVLEADTKAVVELDGNIVRWTLQFEGLHFGDNFTLYSGARTVHYSTNHSNEFFYFCTATNETNNTFLECETETQEESPANYTFVVNVGGQESVPSIDEVRYVLFIRFSQFYLIVL